jgi:hypothetical protein
MHFSFLEDIETLINPQKIVQIKEIASEMKRRLERDGKEAEIKANRSFVIVQFQKCVEENKAKLIDCFLKNVIYKRNEEIKAELQSIKDKMDRKYRLIVEINGQDPKLIQDFLVTYVRGMSRFKELGDAVRNQTGMAATDLVVKKYLHGVEEIFESVKRCVKAKFDEASQAEKTSECAKNSGVLSVERALSKKESTSRIEEYDSPLSDEDEEDCKIIKVVSKKTPSRWTEKKTLRGQEKGPPTQKKIKYNTAQKALVSKTAEESKLNSRVGEMDTEHKKSGRLSPLKCIWLIYFIIAND